MIIIIIFNSCILSEYSGFLIIAGACRVLYDVPSINEAFNEA